MAEAGTVYLRMPCLHQANLIRDFTLLALVVSTMVQQELKMEVSSAAVERCRMEPRTRS